MLIDALQAIRHRIDGSYAADDSAVDLGFSLGLILGSGLGGLANEFTDEIRIPFADLPGFAASTAAGHSGQLVLGNLFGVKAVAMAGRLHQYEGHFRSAITFPVQVFRSLGVETLVVSNAAGGLNPNYCVGDIVIINDHIDASASHRLSRGLGDSLLRGIGSTSSKEKFDLACGDSGTSNEHCFTGNWPIRLPSSIYCPTLVSIAQSAASDGGFQCPVGTYLATLGPNYETRAEYRMMRLMGADLAGMSTVPEAIAGAELKMKVLALSMVSNIANPDQPAVASHDEVLAAGESAAMKMSRIVAAVARWVAQHPE